LWLSIFSSIYLVNLYKHWLFLLKFTGHLFENGGSNPVTKNICRVCTKINSSFCSLLLVDDSLFTWHFAFACQLYVVLWCISLSRFARAKKQRAPAKLIYSRDLAAITRSMTKLARQNPWRGTIAKAKSRSLFEREKWWIRGSLWSAVRGGNMEPEGSRAAASDRKLRQRR
jgi:hypothetical protein